jgi:histidinol-phosphate aminotransferase
VSDRPSDRPQGWPERVPTPRELIRPSLGELGVYALEQIECVHKLDQNEVPWDLPRRVKARVLAELSARDWSRYPDFHAEEVRQALGAFYDRDPAGILVGNGSNELLGVALEAFAHPDGDRPAEVVCHLPSFGLYPMLIRRAGARGVWLGPRDDLQLPLDEIEREVDRDPRRPVLLCTPNNPTGDAAPVEVVDRLLAKLEAPLLLDNAYGEYTERDYLPLLDRHPHLIVLRTFSKMWSLGGLRLGYLLTSPAMVDQLVKVKLPYNLGHPGIVAARVAVEEAHAALRRRRAVVGRRRQWREMLEAAGLDVLPSEASFLLVRTAGPEEARELRHGLMERGILIRDVGGAPGCAGTVRISIGRGRALADTRSALAELGYPPASSLSGGADDDGEVTG